MRHSETTLPAEVLLPPIPGPDPMHRFYWDAVKQHRLCLLRCQNCGHYVHYPRIICDRCQSTNLAPEEISGRGTLYAYTTVMQAGHPYFLDKIPYIIGVVEINEEPGVRLPSGIDAAEEEIRCGMPVHVVFKEITDSLTLPFFRPIQGATDEGQ
jgi:uncharacterized OB-fold protein